MNKPNVRKWVKALRSGEYKQVEGNLKEGDGYCCLGVVCKLAGIRSRRDPSYENRFMFDGCAGTLPNRAVKWLGVDCENPEIGGIPAAELNDISGLTFSEIADRIEKHWLSA